MAWLGVRLGNGRWGVTDLDNPTGAPQINVSQSTFSRILSSNFYDEEDVLIDRPLDYISGFEYVGIASAGSSVDDPVWSVVRVEWSNKKKVGIKFRSNVAWSTHTVGW